MLTIADMLELRAKYQEEAKTLLLKADVLTDLISLAEEKTEAVEEKAEVSSVEPFPVAFDATCENTDESY